MPPLKVIIAVSWAVFWLYWLVSALGSKRNTTSHIRQFVGMRLGIIILATILFSATNKRPHFFEKDLAANNEPMLIAGLIIFLVGMFLAVWARIYLGRNWGMPMAQKQSPELVTSGPYQYVRHPIYTGILLMMIGSVLDISAYWLAVLVIAAVYSIYSATVEEKLMTKQFPKVYPEYKRGTKMLIPFVF